MATVTPQQQQEPAKDLAKRTRELADGLSHIPEEAIASVLPQPDDDGPVRKPSIQRLIIRQTAIKCSTDLVAARQIKIEDMFRFSNRIVDWIYSRKAS